MRKHVCSRVLRDLITQYVHYSVEDGGTFHTPTAGISRGCPLSPLMGALHLYDMDEHFGRQEGIHYARYMDDIIILAKTRWSLRRHTKRLMQWFSERGFEAHPDKTFIGRTHKGFDWMGAWLTHEGVTDIAPRAKANHREKVRRLYEQLARIPAYLRKRREKQVHARVSTYRKRWHIWASTLLLVSGTSHADGVIVVPGTITAGLTGYFIPTSKTQQAATPTNMQAWGDGYHQCLSTSSYSCWWDRWGTPSNNLEPLTPTEMNSLLPGISLFGFRVMSDDIYLIIHGTMDGKYYQQDWSMCYSHFDDKAGWENGPGGCGKYTVENKGGLAQGYPAFNWDLQNNPSASNFRANAPAFASVNLSFQVYLSNDTTPGATNVPPIYSLDMLSSSSVPIIYQINKPTALIVTGLSCNLTANKPSLDLGQVSTSPPGSQDSIIAGPATLQVSVNCSGTNASDAQAVLRVGLGLSGSGDTSIANGYQLTNADAPGVYATLGLATRTGCSSTGSMSTTSPLPVHTYNPSDTGTTTVLSLDARLCKGASQVSIPVGPHSLAATISIVNY